VGALAPPAQGEVAGDPGAGGLARAVLAFQALRARPFEERRAPAPEGRAAREPVLFAEAALTAEGNP
jgi:hypothetical protein